MKEGEIYSSPPLFCTVMAEKGNCALDSSWGCLSLWIDDAHSIYGFFLITQANIVLGLPEL
ncbi:hypothetical protein ANAPC1_00143 [Anaplasma phagocytophilum]|uniref:Uncharacterized protein n=1 Tax=Anaplasma phagocytophilum TaxID=948 RepID=A0AA45US41_ANAPH|nr:hypothetical protein ANAPC1_00143 [Anaplasma phagocytophilum]